MALKCGPVKGQISELSVKRNTRRKGFIIFAVIGILGILGLALFSLSWVSRQQNVQSHKTYYNEVALNLAEAGTRLLASAMRRGIQTPTPLELKSIVTNGDFEKNFYAFFLQNADHFNGPEGEAEFNDSLLRSYFDKSILDVEKNLLARYPTAEIEYTLVTRALPLYKDDIIKDQVPKLLEMRLIASAHYRGSQAAFEIHKKLKLYSLLTPLLSKFTLYHKEGIGRRYNKFKGNLIGQPALSPNGRPQSPYLFPLVLFNGPLNNNSPIPPDSLLLRGAGGQDPSSFDILASPSKVEESRDAILRRGFLYFGPGQEKDNVLNLTSGAYDEDSLFGGFGEYFNLFNIHLPGGAQTFPALLTDVPDFFQQAYEVENRFDDQPPEMSVGTVHLRALYEGYYTPDATNGNQQTPDSLITDGSYHHFSSLIHPFGTNEAPSRAYTVGAAHRAFARITSVGLDRIENNQDEGQQSACFGYPTDPRDGTVTYLMQTNENGFLNPIPDITLRSINLNPENLNKEHIINQQRVDCPEEPRTMRLGGEFSYPNMFEDYENYERYMSTVQYVPMNHMLDYVHYSHAFIPPNAHPSFQEFMFEPRNKDRLMDLPDIDTEAWPLPESPLHKKDQLYLEGSPDSFQPDQWIQDHHFFKVDSMKQFEETGFLNDNGTSYSLDGRGHHILLLGDLILDKPVDLQNDVSLFVTGQCVLPPVRGSFYASFHCQEIGLANPTNLRDPQWEAHLNSRSKIYKVDPSMPVYVFGSVAASRIDFSFFEAPSVFHYLAEFSPLEPDQAFFYRVALDDHKFGSFRRMQ